MNKPLTDAELAARMREYNGQVIDMITGLFSKPPARQMGEADDQYLARNEDRIQAPFYAAVAAFRSVVLDTQAGTNLANVKDDMRLLLDALSDYVPGRDHWNEEVYNATHAGRA